MKSPVTFALGLIVGAAIVLAVIFIRPGKSSAEPDTTRGGHSDASGKVTEMKYSPAAPVQEEAPNAREPAGQSLQAALREIGEAGLVVIPQELLGMFPSQFVFNAAFPSARHTFRLDTREIAVLNAARVRFERAILEASNRNVEIIEANDRTLVFNTTTLPEQRRRLITDMRTEIVRGLDEDSATLFTYLDIEKALGPSTAGLENATVLIRRAPGDANLHITINDGNASRVASMPPELLSQIYPALKDYLSALR